MVCTATDFTHAAASLTAIQKLAAKGSKQVLTSAINADVYLEITHRKCSDIRPLVRITSMCY